MTTNPIQATPIRIAETDEDILRCFPVMHELRPHLQSETFLSTIHARQRGGYFLALLEADGGVPAATGYRFSEHLARGRFLYVDDLVTLSTYRRKGYGKQLFEWLVTLAETSDCRELHLDSGLQRAGAHLFYEEQGMIFASRHYSLKLKTP